MYAILGATGNVGSVIANTLLAKTPALGEDALTVTDLGLQIKAAIEKLREQVQNVE